jgi:hypothetical protein
MIFYMSLFRPAELHIPLHGFTTISQQNAFLVDFEEMPE